MIFIPEEEYIKITAVLPILCVDCLIVHEKKCLLLSRKREPAKGQYWFPGGRVSKSETIKDAALRKAREEVSIACQFEGIISVEETVFAKTGEMICDIHTVNICCHLTPLRLDSMKIHESNEFHDHYIWFSMEDKNHFNLHPAVIGPIFKYYCQYT